MSTSKRPATQTARIARAPAIPAVATFGVGAAVGSSVTHSSPCSSIRRIFALLVPFGVRVAHRVVARSAGFLAHETGPLVHRQRKPADVAIRAADPHG